MLSLNRRYFCLSSLALASGCGFEPVYGPTGSAQALRGSVLVDAPNDKNSFDLTKHLEGRLGRATDPRFGLSYLIETRIDPLGITPNQETTRYNVLGKIVFALRDLNTQNILTEGVAENFTSFGATSNPVSTRTASEAAFERLMIVLGDDITEHLILNSGSFLP